MTFDIKKFLKDTKAGPYGMIQESAKKKTNLKENYIDLMPVGGGNLFKGYTKALTEDETYLGPKKPASNKIYNSPQGDEEYSQDNAWMQDIDAEQVGEFIVSFEEPGIITWNKQGAEEDIFFAATPKWDGQPGTPIEAIFADGDPDTEMIYVEKQDEFVSFQEYAETIYPIIKKYLESKRKDIHGEMFEEEDMNEHQEEYLQIAKQAGSFESAVERLEDYGVNGMLANQIASDVWTEEGELKEYGFDDSDLDDPDIEAQSDRIMDLGGDNIEQGIISLMDDGFDPIEIMDLCKKIIRNAKHEKRAGLGERF
jgi:hypothetical protein